MSIRTYQPGDEVGQAAIYNAAAGALPGFKIAHPEEMLRRTRARDFDPKARTFAVEDGCVVGYCVFQPNGPVGFLGMQAYDDFPLACAFLVEPDRIWTQVGEYNLKSLQGTMQP